MTHQQAPLYVKRIPFYAISDRATKHLDYHLPHFAKEICQRKKVDDNDSFLIAARDPKGTVHFAGRVIVDYRTLIQLYGEPSRVHEGGKRAFWVIVTQYGCYAIIRSSGDEGQRVEDITAWHIEGFNSRYYRDMWDACDVSLGQLFQKKE